MRVLDRRVAELERQAPAPPPALMREVEAFLAGLSCDQLQRLERVLDLWPEGEAVPLDLAQAILDVGATLDAHGLELALQSARRFSRADLEAMSPRERADAYRTLIRGEDHARRL